MSDLKKDINLLKASSLFDSSWYLSEYRDVAKLAIDPAEHYLRFGAHMLRNPSLKFDTAHYLNSYPDVAAEGVNPLVHFLQFGMKEGRTPLPYAAPIQEYSNIVGIDIVVPVFNALEDTKLCLESIRRKCDGFTVRVFVINDGSDDETTTWLREYCKTYSNFLVIENETNQGYTKSVNTGLKATSASYVITLNSDTVVTSGWLNGLLRCITSDPAIGIVGPLSNAASWQNVPVLYDADGLFAVNSLPDGMNPDEMARIIAAVSSRTYPKLPFINGFCFMMKRQVIDRIGFMDELNFPVGYGEENDYCIRAADAGFKLAVADDVYVHHAKSKSFGHLKRKELSKQGSEALKRKHTNSKLDPLLKKISNTETLDVIRSAVAAALSKHGLNTADLMTMRILFLLPAAGGGGGAHSVVQEAAEMRRLGVRANVAILLTQHEQYLEVYRDIPNASDLFVGFEQHNIAELASSYDVVIATIFSSVSLLKQITEAHPHILPAYYVQDYEPLFFPPDSPNWKEAKQSYSLIPGALLFAKTQWIVNKVAAEHGVQVHKVEPSIDHDVYRPAARSRDGRLHVTAMIRPQTPRRGAERTMRVLSRLAQARPGKLAFHLFGCNEDVLRLPALQADFQYKCYGQLSRLEVANLLRASDLFVDLSDYQAFGRTALEAMACGCTAMVPAYGGTDEYAIDGVNALVVETDKEDQCFTRLLAQVDNTKGLQQMQLEGLHTASRFSVHAAAISELVVLNKALANWRGTHQQSAELGVTTPQARALSVKPQRKLPITILVITWDIGHNPLGRSYMLAEVLDRVARNVVTIGFQFPRYGNDVWEPVREGRLPVISLPGQNFPELLHTFEQIAERVRPDLVIACKPRLPSTQLAAMIKDKFGCPMILDIDDHELSFFKDAKEVTIEDLESMADGEAKADVEPYNALWTQVAQHLRKYADNIIVSNVALQAEFGGLVVPHVRDETIFDPALYSRDQSRQKYNIPAEARVVLFFGTPRHHKGINVLAQAVQAIADPNFKLVVVGSTTDKSVTAKLDQLAPGRIIYLPNQPFSAIPEIMVVADVVCLPQDEDNPISKFQLPAKAIDAIAMGIPLLVTRTQPLIQLVRDGVAVAIDIDTLPSVIEATARHDVRHRWAQQTRPIFLGKYSYEASAEAMRHLITRTMRDNDRTKTADLHEFMEQQRRVLGIVPEPQALEHGGIDVVVFWKQNDTGMYGRRSDMVIKYLASRADVRRVIVFDAPMSEHDLLVRRNKPGKATQDRLLYIKTYEKLLGKLDSDKVKHDVFLYPPGVYRNSDDGTDRPHLQDAYIEYLGRVLERYGVEPSDAVFWVYPKNYMAPAILDYFKPSKIVVDVVDDHRAWPGISPAEHERLTENYRETLARADMAFVNCEPMIDAMREFYPAIRCVPNGCDLNPPREQPRNDPEYEAFCSWTGKTIGFVGNLEQKIDIELIAKIAVTYSDCQIVLVGSTHANPAVTELKKYSNVRMPGVVPYAQVGAWLSRFDVGIIPHRDMDMTRSMNPLKLYVYLAWKIPVVSTEVFNVDRTSRFVHIADSHSAFLENIKKALEAGRIDDDDLRQYVAENSWDARLNSHVDSLLSGELSRTRSI